MDDEGVRTYGRWPTASFDRLTRIGHPAGICIEGVRTICKTSSGSRTRSDPNRSDPNRSDPNRSDPNQPDPNPLATNVANFLTRAEKVLARPVAGQPPSLPVLMHFDPESTRLTSIDIDWDHIPEESWVYLAVLMRPIVFNQTEPINFTVLTKRSREPTTGSGNR